MPDTPIPGQVADLQQALARCPVCLLIAQMRGKTLHEGVLLLHSLVQFECRTCQQPWGTHRWDHPHLRRSDGSSCTGITA